MLTFGLGEETEPARIDILYMDGRTQTIENTEADTQVEVDPAQAQAPDDAEEGDSGGAE